MLPVPKSVFGSWWNSLPFLYGKGKGNANGKGESKGKGTKGLGKGKNKGHSFGLYGPQLVNVLEGCNTDAEAAWQDTWDYQKNEWQHIGMLGKVSKVKPTKDCASGPRYNFNALSSDNEEPQKQVDPLLQQRPLNRLRG